MNDDGSHYGYHLGARSARAMELFASLGLQPDVEERLRPGMRVHARLMAASEAMWERLGALSLAAVCILMLPTAVAVEWWSTSWFPTNAPPAWQALLVAFGDAIASVALYIVLSLVFLFDWRKRPVIVYSMVQPACLGGLAFAAVAVRSGAAIGLRQQLAAILIDTALLTTLMLLAGAVVDVITTAQLRSRYAHSEAVSLYLGLIHDVGGSLDGWFDHESKRRMVQQLERIARLLEAIGESSCGDMVTDRWFKDTMRSAAAWLRQLKRTVMAPPVGAVEHLRRELVDHVPHVIAGSWMELGDQAAPEPAASVWTTAVRLTGRLVAGAVPLGALIALQSSPLRLPAAIAGGLFGLLTIWALLSLLMMDPLYPQKIEAMPTFMSAVGLAVGKK